MMVICFFLGSTLRKELDSVASDWDTGHTRTMTFTWGVSRAQQSKHSCDFTVIDYSSTADWQQQHRADMKTLHL